MQEQSGKKPQIEGTLLVEVIINKVVVSFPGQLLSRQK